MRSLDRLRPWQVVAFLVTGGVALLAIVTVLSMAVLHGSHNPASRSTPTTTPTATVSQPAPATGSHDPTAVGDEVDQLAAAPTIAPATHGRISGQEDSQPDLYASAFVRRLLTQDYRQTREDQLAWVQAESVVSTEPLVVGLVPDRLRPRMAAFSVIDPSTGDALVPTQAAWEDLGQQQAYTTVTIQRVLEPLAWSNAVEAGAITDPGITGRQVLATVTRHTGTTTKEFSVAVTLNIEGPPTQDAWRFVTIVAVRSVPSLAS